MLGHLRPSALYILSLFGKFAHAHSWNAAVPGELVDKCRELEKMIVDSDPVNSRWGIPDPREWVLATDASAQGLGWCLTTLDDWNRNSTADCVIIEDHAWLVKQSEVHINVLELNAVIEEFKLLTGYARKGDRVLILIDNTSVAAWLTQVLTDKKTMCYRPL